MPPLTLSDGVGFLNLVVRQNQRFNPKLVLTQNGMPVNLTGCTVKSQLRIKAGDPDPPVLVFDVTISDAVNGVIQFDTDFSSVPVKTYVYDIVVTDASGAPWTLFAGSVTVHVGVTRA